MTESRDRLARSLELHVRTLQALGQRQLPRGEPPPAPPPPPDALPTLATEVASCTRCNLHRSRSRTVFGEGDPAARIVFVGEGPGQVEDRTGRPFVGPAGKLLDAMIKAMGLRREEVYIANVVKCRPPGNRQPLPDEMGACRPYLDRQLSSIRPEVIVLLGGVALGGLFPRVGGITRNRGHWLQHEGIPVMPTFHPAYLLRNPAEKKAVWQDLKEVLQRLDLPIPANPSDPSPSR